MSVMNVGKLSLKEHTSVHIREYTQGKNPMSVINVGKLLLITQPLGYITEFTQGRNPMNVMNVGKHSPRHHISEHT
jgi:hypothetical protein